jgi:hypothetical protein
MLWLLVLESICCVVPGPYVDIMALLLCGTQLLLASADTCHWLRISKRTQEEEEGEATTKPALGAFWTSKGAKKEHEHHLLQVKVVWCLFLSLGNDCLLQSLPIGKLTCYIARFHLTRSIIGCQFDMLQCKRSSV